MDVSFPPIGNYEQYQEQFQHQQPLRDEIGYYNFVKHSDDTESRFYVHGFCSRWIKTQNDKSRIIYHFENETGNYCWYFQWSERTPLLKHNFDSNQPTEVSQTKGFRAWYHMNVLHRWNGEPAVIYYSGKKVFAFLGETTNFMHSYIQKLILYCKQKISEYDEIESALHNLPNCGVQIIEDYFFEFDIDLIRQQYNMLNEEFEKLSSDIALFETLPSIAKVPTVHKYRSIFNPKK